MRVLFADTFYWAALLNPRDAWYSKARVLSRNLAPVHLVTTDEVLTEFLNFFSSFDSIMRQGAAQRVQNILQNNNVRVVHQTRESFLAGLELYLSRPDKEYSLTDCISMCVMRQLNIFEVLTHDKHFAQEGFVILFQNVP